MSDFKKLLKDQLEDPEFRAEYEALEPEFATADDLEAIHAAREEYARVETVSHNDINWD